MRQIVVINLHDLGKRADISVLLQIVSILLSDDRHVDQVVILLCPLGDLGEQGQTPVARISFRTRERPSFEHED